MSGLLFLALGLLLAQALPDDAPTTSASPQPASSVADDLAATTQACADFHRPGQSRANATSPQPALASSNASVAGRRGLDGTPPTDKTSSSPDATSPGTSWSDDAPGSTSPATPASSTSASSSSSDSAEPPEHSEQAAQKPDEPAAVSSGVVALVMAVVFGLLVVIVYAGLLLWRRYLEYRYGNRELLVNDLEFDTSDLRHFEL